MFEFEELMQNIVNETGFIRKYSAIAAENYDPKNGNWLRFTIPELTPWMTGHLQDNPLKMKRKYTNEFGVKGLSKGTHNNHLIGQYYSEDTYRKTPPDVQLGERITVWQKADSDTWFWTANTQDMMSKRRLETVVQTVNADKPTGEDSGVHDASNTYFVEMSSKNKTYTVQTSKVNGEVAAYTIQINAKDGIIVLCDDEGNLIELATKTAEIILRNNYNTKIQLLKDSINIECDKDINVKAGGNLKADIGKDAMINVGGNCNIKASSVKIDAPNTVITGDVTIQKSLNVKGGTTMGGGGIAKGSMGVDGSFSVSGPSSLSGGSSSGVIYGSYIDT